MNIIGKKICWVCGGELPLKSVPDGCTTACAFLLREYGNIADSEERAYLCDTHHIIWYDGQREYILNQKLPTKKE